MRDDTDHERTLTGDLAPAPAPLVVSVPATIGEYRILGKLGEGGMGVVFEAEQPSPRRRVALKVVRGGAYVDDLRLRMFQREVETLARLKHPNIAAIYEAGRTEDGQHFFAMELVQGQRLDEYLRTRPAPTSRSELSLRLRLFRKICNAVYYAHQRGVIHRDLKPSNMVVVADGEAGAEPEVKVLDFGLARITDGDVRQTMVTEVGMIKGTLQYMSPEQAKGDPDEIDVRTDVYALGVILYQMLSGRLPYETQATSIVEALRVVCEVPPRPLHEVWPAGHRVDGDLETIIGKALEKEADRRYASAAGLAGDVGRYLDSQPILARPPSTMYQLRKAIARNRVPSTLAACVLLLIVGSAIALGILLRRARVAETEATANFDVAREAVDRYLSRVAESPDLKARGLETLRRNLLATAEEFYRRLAERGGETVALRADLGRAQGRLAKIYGTIGESGAAEKAYQRAIDVLRGVAGNETLKDDLASVEGDYGLFLTDHGRFPEAERVFGEALATTREPFRLALLNDRLGIMLGRAGRGAEAEAAYHQAIALREALAGKNPTFDNRYPLVESYNNLGMLYATTGKPADAERLFRKATELIAEIAPQRPDDPVVVNAAAASHGNLAGALVLLGRLGEAEAEYHAELVPRETLAREHPRVIDYQVELGSVYTNLGELDTRAGNPGDALPWLDRGISTFQALLAVEPRQNVGRYSLSYTYGWRARALSALGRSTQALADWDRAIAFDDRHDPQLIAERAKVQRAIQGGA
jgi:eukaryotic-like serine/threonine-protein kinase